MMKKNKEQSIPIVPIVVLMVYIGLVFFVRSKLPESEEMIRIITEFYKSYGYTVVFLSSLVEGSFVIGMYFPGSAAILLGAVVAKSGTVSLPLVILLGTLGLMLGYVSNYFLGKHGWYKVLEKFGIEEGMKEAQKKLEKHEKKALFLGYISPNSGSLVSTAAGVLKLPFKTFFFITLFSQLLWSTVWGSIAYIFGAVFVELFLKYFAFAVLLILAIYFGWQWWQRRRKRK